MKEKNDMLKNTLKKDYQLIKQTFGIARERNYIKNDFFVGYYGIQMPKSIKKTQKVKSFEYNNLGNTNIFIPKRKENKVS